MMRTSTDEDRRMTISGRAARFLATLIVGAVALAGCALVDDARREAGSGPDPRPGRTADAGGGAATPTRSGGPAGPSATRSPTDETTDDTADETADASGGCPPSGVLLRIGSRDAAMGLRVLGVELVNCGPVPVTLNGYPEVRLLDGDRVALPVTVLRGTTAVALIPGFDTPPAPVTAAPGERLVVGLAWRNLTEAGEVIKGTYLQIVPAPGLPPQTVRPDGPIDLGTTGRLGVTAWGTPKR